MTLNEVVKSNLPRFDRYLLEDWLSLDDYILITDTVPEREIIPNYFSLIGTSMMFLKKGEVKGTINLERVDVKAPCVIVLLDDSVVHIDNISADLDFRVISYGKRLEADLQMQAFSTLSYQAVQRQPFCIMREDQMQFALVQYNSIEQLLLSSRDNKYLKLCIVNILRSLFYYLIGSYPLHFENPAPLSRAAQLTADFTDLARNNCNKGYDIKWYAQRLNTTPKYLSDAAKANTGKTASALIDEYILLRAKTLLLTSNVSIQQISDQLGFANQSHFGSWFCRQTGVRPKEFRNNSIL